MIGTSQHETGQDGTRLDKTGQTPPTKDHDTHGTRRWAFDVFSCTN